jgi:hypothetical protein
MSNKIKSNKSNKLTLQDWIDKITKEKLDRNVILEYKLHHKLSKYDYFIIIKAMKPDYMVSYNSENYKNEIQIYSQLKGKITKYEPSFLELSNADWDLYVEDNLCTVKIFS